MRSYFCFYKQKLVLNKDESSVSDQQIEYYTVTRNFSVKYLKEDLQYIGHGALMIYIGADIIRRCWYCYGYCWSCSGVLIVITTQ